MRTQVMPQVLHRTIPASTAATDQAHIAGHHHILTGVEARPVPDHTHAHPATCANCSNRLTTSVFSVGMITADIAPVGAQTAAGRRAS